MRQMAWLNVLAFKLALGVLGILFFVVPKEEISTAENRRLAVYPALTGSSLLKGTYTDSLDTWYSDHFPFRDAWMEAGVAIKGLYGPPTEEKLYLGSAVVADTTEADSASLAADTLIAAADTLPEPSGHENQSLFIVNGRALQLFGGSRKVVGRLAHVLSKYRRALPASVNVYCGIVPSATEFYLPEKYDRMSGSERDNITYAYSLMDTAGVKTFDAAGNIAQHTGEYIYFNTDHHWTGRGAYYAYAAWCQSAGIAPVPIDQMSRKFISGFYGALYWQTRDPELLETGDSVEYFETAVKTRTTYIPNEGGTRERAGTFLAKYAKGGSAYGVFLAGDYPFMRIETDVKNNGRKVLIVKNSYGNPFVTFFVNHFEKVFVVDYRYYYGSLPALVEKEGITDVVVLHNSFSANTQWHIWNTERLLRHSRPPAPKPKKAATDSTATTGTTGTTGTTDPKAAEPATDPAPAADQPPAPKPEPAPDK